ncbi:MAG TPA: hypothetical protein VF981_02505 [Gemmatimonadaceae bacterium]
MTRIGITTVAVASLATTLNGQMTMQRISERTGAAPDGFSQATTLQELPDGRVVVVDTRDRALMLVDFEAGTMTRLGRPGSGPNEYNGTGPLVRIAGDTLVMIEFGARRLHLIPPDGRLAGSRLFDVMLADVVTGERQPDGAARVVGGPRFADSRGRLYHQVTYLERATSSIAPESWILRLDPRSGDSRVVAPLRNWYPERSTRWRAPMMSQDVWAVAPDGRVARVIPHPYHVEWYRDDSLVAKGATVPFEPVRVTDGDRRAYRAARAAQRPGGAQISGPPATGGRNNSRRPPARGDVTDADFPTVKPPFVEELAGTAARISPEGEVWVTRTRALGDSVVSLDVFDDSARLTRRVILPPHRILLGFGRGTLHLLRVDEDGLQWLERYRR